MASASPFLRTVLAGACGVTFVLITAALGHWVDVSRDDWNWLVLPATLPILQPLNARADLVLDVLKVALVLASAILIAVRGRKSTRQGVQVAVVLLLANASVQGLKHWPGQPFAVVTGVEPLSGHAALVGAVALTWLGTTRSSRSLFAVSMAAAPVVLTCFAAMVPGRHSPMEVACPLLICLGWALALVVLGSELPQRRKLATGGGMAVLGFSLILLSLAPSTWWQEPFGVAAVDVRLVVVSAFVSGAALFVVGATATCASVLGKADRSAPGASAPVLMTASPLD